MNEPRICPETGLPCDPSCCDFFSAECLTDFESEFWEALGLNSEES